MAGCYAQHALCSLPLTLVKEVMFGEKHLRTLIVVRSVDIPIAFLQAVTVRTHEDGGLLELLRSNKNIMFLYPFSGWRILQVG